MEVKFTRKGMDEGSQYFIGRKTEKRSRKGVLHTHYTVDRVFIMDKYRAGHIEVDNVFKGVEFLPHEITLL